ncbi:MAG: hypothetical protein U1F51_03305 [Burkholderiales bacterium]
MFARAGTWIACLALSLVTGCATVQKQAYDRAAHRDVASVGLLTPHPTKEYPVVNVGHLGNSFGLIGVLVASTDRELKTKEFTTAAQARGLDVAKLYEETLKTGLEKMGYRVVVISVERPRGLFLDSYDNLAPGIDIYVDSNVGAGYLAASGTADYLPNVGTNTRVVKRASKEIVYREIVNYGYESRIGAAVSIASDPRYRYSDFSALMSNVDDAVDALRIGVARVAERTLLDLAR